MLMLMFVVLVVFDYYGIDVLNFVFDDVSVMFVLLFMGVVELLMF